MTKSENGQLDVMLWTERDKIDDDGLDRQGLQQRRAPESVLFKIQGLQMQIKARTHPSRWIFLIRSVDGDTEKLDLLYTIGRKVKWYSHYRKKYGCFKKIKHKITIWSSSSAFGYIPKIIKRRDSNRILYILFIAEYKVSIGIMKNCWKW